MVQTDDLGGMVRGNRFALVTTRDMDGTLHTEPMEAVDRVFDGTLWFPTSAATPVIDYISACPSIQVTYLDRSSAKYLVLDGIASIRHHPTLDGAGPSRPATWFFHGARDVTPAFIRVDVISADLWE